MVVCSGVTSGGAKYEIDDRYMVPRGSDEERRIIEEQRQMAYKILLEYAEMRSKEQTA